MKKKTSVYSAYIIAFCIGIYLVAYVFSLLYSNYTSQTELRKNQVTELKQDTEIRAASIDYFFTERRDDVVHLASSREISSFFENKALGMSMEYGLNLSLIPIRKLFSDMMERKQVGNDKIYSRIVLIDRDGSILVDVSGKEQQIPGPKRGKYLLNREDKNGIITASRDQKELLASISYYHKDRYAGQIIMWIRPEIIGKHLLKEKTPGTRRMLIVAPAGNRFLSIGGAPASPPLNPTELPSLAVGEIKEFEAGKEGSIDRKRIALRVPVKDTPFSLVRITDAKDVFGDLNPDQLLINMAIQAAVIFAGVFIIFGLMVRSLILQTRLEDSTIRERDVGEKNQQLELEIMERKRAEEAFRESESRLAAITGSARDAILMMDQEGKITYWNPAAEDVFYYMCDEAMGQDLHGLITPPQYHAAYLAALPEFKRSGKGAAVGKTLELQAKRKDGREITISLSMSAVNIKGGWHAVGVVRDISEQKLAAELLRQAKEEAEAANQAKSEFLANMSHEIRTPMNAILGMAELLAETPLSREQDKYVHLFRDAGENLLTLINDILDISKVEAGQIKLEAVPFRIDELIEKTGEILGVRAGYKGLDLICHYQSDLPVEVIGDPLRLQQSLTNLIGNAIKFTEKGEVVLMVKAATPIDPAAEEMELLFSVTDTGIGISAEQMDHIFEKFTQADASTSRKYGGTGLGLTITRHFVELMGGTLSVQSEPEKGSVFSFIIPLAIQDQPRHREEDHAPPDLHHVRILVVDDNATNRMIVTEFLSSWGVTVTEASGGEEGLSFLHSACDAGKPFQLAILDYQMPELDGFETAKRIKAQPALKETNMILLTSLQRKDDMKKATEIGFAYVLYKPVKKADLKEAVINSLGSREVTDDPLLSRTSDHRRMEKEGQPHANIPVPMPQRAFRILMAEDNEDNRTLIRMYMKSSPHDIQMVENGRLAVDKFINEGPFDLVLMDIQMPVMNGYEATRAIRAWEAAQQDRKRTPIVAMTAHALTDDLQKSFDAGCDDHLTKPLKKAKFIETINRYAEEKMMTCPAVPKRGGFILGGNI